MSFNNHNSNPGAFPNSNLGSAGAGFGTRGPRYNSKRLSVALPDSAQPNDNVAGAPTPRTSRSHLLAGLRTQPKTPGAPASAPFHQTQHSMNGLAASRWADAQPSYNDYTQHVPQTSTGAAFDMSAHQQQAAAMRAGHQMYSLPEQVLAPPALYDQSADIDPSLLQQLQMTSVFLAQRQQQLQQKLAALSVQDQTNALSQAALSAQYPPTPHTPQTFYNQQQQQYQQKQMQPPIEVQPGVYLVFNPATQAYSYAYDQNAQLMSDQAIHAASLGQQYDQINKPALSNERTRSFTPPKKSTSPPNLEHVEPLPPPSANAFRRGHKKASSLAINPALAAADGPKTSSAASFGTQRAVVPPPPMTGTFGPGSARAGEHPMRQPRGPPPLEELVAAPTSKIEGSKNFATRQRRRALDSLMRAGTQRRGVSRSSGGSPTSEREYNFTIHEDILGEELASTTSSAVGSRKMSPIGHEMKQKRGSTLR